MKHLICAIVVGALAFARGEGTNVWFKSFGEWANANCPLGVWRFVESNGIERSFLVCPKTSKVYEIRNGHVDVRMDVELDPRAFASMYWPTNWIVGEACSDLVGYINVRFTQGETTFGYPYDMQFESGFESSEILASPFDGDFLCYESGSRRVTACATFGPDGKSIRWHEPETFELIKTFPYPDPNSEFCYYRRQGTNTTISLGGGVKLKGPHTYSYLEHGILGAKQLAGERPIERENWRQSLLGGYIKWTEELPKTSIRDPRRFYACLKDGRRAFAMIQEDHRHLVSPITHAILTVPKSDIVGFEAISDNSYKEDQCYSAGEVEELFAEYGNEKDLKDPHWLILISAILAGLVGSFAERIYSLITGKTSAFLERHRLVRFWLIVLLIASTVIWCVMG